jgi:hypothetical protein
MLRSRITWLIPVALTLVGLASSVKSAIAQTNDKIMNLAFPTQYLPTLIPPLDQT